MTNPSENEKALFDFVEARILAAVAAHRMNEWERLHSECTSEFFKAQKVLEDLGIPIPEMEPVKDIGDSRMILSARLGKMI